MARRILTAREQAEMFTPWHTATSAREYDPSQTTDYVLDPRLTHPPGKRDDLRMRDFGPVDWSYQGHPGYNQHDVDPTYFLKDEQGKPLGDTWPYMPPDDMHQRLNTKQANMDSVTLYTKPDCQACRLTKHRLDHHGIPHQVVDVTTDPDAYNHVTQNLGYISAPVVDAGNGNHWSGFRPDRIQGLLG